MSIFEELKRRNVFRVGIAYIVASWVTLQVADLVLEAIKAPDWALPALMFLLALGFVASVIVAWAYEMTAEGIRREADVDRNTSVTHHTAAKLDRLTIALVIAAVAIVAIDRLVPEQQETSSSVSPTAQTTDKGNATPNADSDTQTNPGDTTDAFASGPSVAVLPFVNMSSDPEQAYFSDGISEEILNVLTRIPNLKVAARTSSFQFKGQNQDIANIARQLRVNHILEGSVRKAGDQLRITAQLIEAQSGFHLWSDTFDRKLEDVFAIQDEIAGAIAGELRARLTSEPLEGSQAVNLEAYELYLKGRSLVAGRKVDDLLEGMDILKAAIAIEPDYVAAMATLAKAYVVFPYFSTRFSTNEMREQARLWADKALALEANHPEASAVKSVVLSEADLNPGAALKLMQNTVRVHPGNLAVNNFLGDVLLRTGAIKEAIYYESRAAELDPLAPVHLSDLSYAYLMQGDFEKALDLSTRGLKLDPAFFQSHSGMISAYWALGNLAKLEQAIENNIQSNDFSEADLRNWRSRLQLAKGQTKEASENLLISYREAKAGQADATNFAIAAVSHGAFDLAGELLLKAYAEKDGRWMFPVWVRLPEQAPDSAPWQEFWRLPEPALLAEMRRANGMNPHFPKFGEHRDGNQ